jgi:hypothetical protein
MTNEEKIERLKSLESMMDDCMSEVNRLMWISPHPWTIIQDSIEEEISLIQAEEDYDDDE